MISPVKSPEFLSNTSKSVLLFISQTPNNLRFLKVIEYGYTRKLTDKPKDLNSLLISCCLALIVCIDDN